MKKFAINTVLEADNICNYQKERLLFAKGLNRGARFVLYGLRNTGKTSLIQSIVIPDFLKAHSNAFAIRCNFIGVDSSNAIANKIQLGLSEALLTYYPTSTRFKQLTQLFSKLRATVSIDPLTSSPTLSLDIAGKRTPTIFDVFSEIKILSTKNRILLFIDEFQDCGFVKGAEGALRECLESLPDSAAIILSGSKKHMLSKIFAQAKAPLAGFGEDLELQPIQYDEYTQYINERFAVSKLKIENATSEKLQNLMHRIPEAINMLCVQILNMNYPSGTISYAQVLNSLAALLESRQSRFEEQIGRFSEAEQKFLIALAHVEFESKPQGKEFLMLCKLSQKGVAKIVIRLENDAVIYREARGYFIADPLMFLYLRRYRPMNG